MSQNYPVYGVKTPSFTIDEFDWDVVEIGPHDVAIEVTHCGICHSDIHRLNDEWSAHGVKTFFPLCPGHEVVGRITQVGSEVNNFKTGDVVCCGPQRSCQCHLKFFPNSDNYCDECKKGNENVCRSGPIPLYNGPNGGFGSQVRLPAAFTFHVPENMKDKLHYVAPLTCAGLTVFSPLKRANLPKGSKVGIIGVGGLGHIAVQIAVAMGFDAYGITTSENKFPDVLKYGANPINSNNDEDMANHALSFDYILNTVAAGICLDKYLSLLKKRATFCYVGLGTEKIQINPFALVLKEISICGSYVGSPRDMIEMLDFCGEHKIFPSIEVVEAPFGENNKDKVTEAVSKVINNTVRYRMVLDYKK